MSVLPFASPRFFDPEAIEIMASVLQGLCGELGLTPRADRMTEILARHVIAAAQTGIRNEAAIRISVLQQFTSNPQ
jgi:hypothetical protein